MPFDIGAGFAEMGKTVANQAGAEALELQRSQLETQKDQLISQLTEGRETRLAGVKAGYDTQLEKSREDAAMARTNVTEAGADRRTAMQLQNNLQEISARTKGQIAVAAAEHGLDAKDITSIETDDNTGKKFGITKTGQKVDLGITGPNAADEKLMARAEKFGMTKKTVVDPDTGEKTTEDEIDPQKAADFLRRQGRDDLAKGYAAAKAPVIPAIPKGVPPGSQYSPSRKMWRDPQGNLYDMNGSPVGGGNSAAAAAPASPAPRGIINMPTPGL